MSLSYENLIFEGWWYVFIYNGIQVWQQLSGDPLISWITTFYSFGIIIRVVVNILIKFNTYKAVLVLLHA
jgi:hypothetical protein